MKCSPVRRVRWDKTRHGSGRQLRMSSCRQPTSQQSMSIRQFGSKPSLLYPVGKYSTTMNKYQQILLLF